jgi:hypothetical protein
MSLTQSQAPFQVVNVNRVAACKVLGQTHGLFGIRNHVVEVFFQLSNFKLFPRAKFGRGSESCRRSAVFRIDVPRAARSAGLQLRKCLSAEKVRSGSGQCYVPSTPYHPRIPLTSRLDDISNMCGPQLSAFPLALQIQRRRRPQAHPLLPITLSLNQKL